MELSIPDGDFDGDTPRGNADTTEQADLTEEAPTFDEVFNDD